MTADRHADCLSIFGDNAQGRRLCTDLAERAAGLTRRAAGPDPRALVEKAEPADRFAKGRFASGRPSATWRGGPGSGNFGHAGRPGQVGGSAPGGDAAGTATAPGAPGDKGEPVGYGPDDLPRDAHAPAVDWYARDLQDSARVVTDESIRKDYAAGYDSAAIYPAWVPLADLPPEVLAEEEEAATAGAEVEPGAYDWSEYNPRGTFPPVKVARVRGEVHILDGNHRLRYWEAAGFDTVPAWVVDLDMRGQTVERSAQAAPSHGWRKNGPGTSTARIGNRLATIYRDPDAPRGVLRLSLYDNSTGESLAYVMPDGRQVFDFPAQAAQVGEAFLSGADGGAVPVREFLALGGVLRSLESPEVSDMRNPRSPSPFALRNAARLAAADCLDCPEPARIAPSLIRRALRAGERVEALRVEPNGGVYALRAVNNSADIADRPRFALTARSAVRRAMGMQDTPPLVARTFSPAEVARSGLGDPLGRFAFGEGAPVLGGVFDRYTGLRFSSEAARLVYHEANFRKPAGVPVAGAAPGGIVGGPVPVQVKRG